jgi:hypothetical protein
MKITKEFKVIEQLAAWEGGSTLNGSWFKFWSREVHEYDKTCILIR